MAYKDKNKKREADQRYYSKNKEKIRTYLKRYRTENKEKIKAKENESKDIGLHRVWAGRLRREYGITVNDYYEMLKSQNNCCAICKSHQSNHKRRLAVDHCHTTRKVRGLLCTLCNRALGCLKDNITTCYSTMEYLKKNNTPQEINQTEYMI